LGVTAALLVLTATPAHAAISDGALPPETEAELQAIIDKHQARTDAPGILVGVWVPGRGAFMRAQGVRNLSTGARRDAHDRVRIGCITKTFVDALALQLADEGRLSLNDTLDRYAPEIPNADGITTRHLLGDLECRQLPGRPRLHWVKTSSTVQELRLYGLVGSDLVGHLKDKDWLRVQPDRLEACEGLWRRLDASVFLSVVRGHDHRTRMCTVDAKPGVLEARLLAQDRDRFPYGGHIVVQSVGIDISLRQSDVHAPHRIGWQ
jgi:hypothetical protein